MRVLAALFLPACLLAQEPAAPPDSPESAYPAVERFVKVLEQVRERHPDVDKVAYERLVNHALEGMLASLDPHSSFIHPEMATLMKDQPGIDPHIPSLGMTLGWRDDGPYLANLLPDSPATTASLLPGSAILEVDGTPTRELPPSELLARLARQPGEISRLKLKSPAAPRPVDVELTHRLVESRAVTDAHIIPDSTPKVGYIRLSSFTEAAPREVEAALDELEDAGMKGLILDLRGNPGGSLPATVRILGYFLPPATEVVETRGREGQDDSAPLKTPDRQRRKRDYPLAVLIDHMSASASELTAGALQDLDRATIVGETSYGKGSVQNIIPMGGGTALRLTIATYHTPSGNTPHLTGITPDIPVESNDELRRLVMLSQRRDTLSPEESAELKDWQDPAIKAALKSLE